MTSLLDTGVAWLADQMAAHTAHTVTYSRGQVSALIPATHGRTERQTTDEEGTIYTSHTDADFLITVSDLLLGEAPVEPRPGDRIAETVGNVTRVYEVLPRSGQPCYQLDPTSQLYRVFTKRIS